MTDITDEDIAEALRREGWAMARPHEVAIIKAHPNTHRQTLFHAQTIAEKRAVEAEAERWKAAVDELNDAAIERHNRDEAKMAVAVEALERIATVDMGGGFLGAQACRTVAAQALAQLGEQP